MSIINPTTMERQFVDMLRACLGSGLTLDFVKEHVDNLVATGAVQTSMPSDGGPSSVRSHALEATDPATDVRRKSLPKRGAKGKKKS